MGIIALYIITITTTVGITKEIGKTNVTSEIKVKEVAIEREKEQEQVLPLKEIKVAEKPPKKNYAYTINYKTPIYSEPNSNTQKDSLKKAVRVEVLEEKVIETPKEVKVKKDDGTYEVKTNIEKSFWKRVVYGKNNENREGWIRTGSLTEDIHKVIPSNLKNIDFTPVPKKEYPNNPKVDVKGIYLTVNTAASSKRMDELIDLAKRTGINAFVIDVKEDFGKMLFRTDAELKYLGKNDKKYPIADINAFMKKLKDNNIYTIARIVSFKDPTYAAKHPDKAIIKRATGKPFTNSDGVIWVSPHDRYLWEYNVAVAKEAAKVGFNEIQFDYVRFPASNGGKLDKELDYRNFNGESKPETIQKYLKYARKELEPLEVYISADIYGQGSLAGRGGWTWYTGSSSWMYEAGIKYILGLNIVRDFLRIKPCIPKEWKEYSIKYRYGSSIYNITVKNENGKNTGVEKFILNGEEIPDKQVKLNKMGGIYHIDIIM